MKILFVTEKYWPHKGGVSKVVQELAEGLATKGFSVSVLTSENERDTVKNGVKIHQLPFKMKMGYVLGNKKLYKKFFDEHEYDVVIFECVQTWSTDLFFKYKLKNISSYKILHSHGFSGINVKFVSSDFFRFFVFVKKLLFKIRWFFYYKNKEKFKQFDKILFLHEYDSGIGFVKNVNSSIDYLYNYPEEFPENKYFETKKGIVYIANYLENKNQLRALNCYYKADIAEPLCFIGSTNNKYLRKLKKQKYFLDKKYGFRDVSFFYGLDRPQTIEILQSSKLFLMTSKIECFPVVLLEAMANQVPFISSNVGNAKFLTGGVVCFSDFEFVYMLERLCSDSNFYHALVENGKKEISEKYNKEIILSKLVKIIEEGVSNENS
ncbi:MAG: glycosyltransferase family 4 protein [Spirochaetales bacterium]|nr:glycosyltransferase family 4 protein [Spirochaetales bacterium]